MASKARAQANLLGADGKIKATQFGNDTITSDMLAPNLELSGDYVKVPVGTTAERPVSPAVGHLRFNTTFGRLEQYVTDGWRAVDTPPTVTSLAYSGGLLAADPAGGETVTITGTNFQSGATVTFGDTSAASVTVNSSTSITATLPAKSAGDYDVKVTNANGLSATLQNGIAYNGLPSFTTPAGKIGDSLVPNTTISTITIVAAEPDSGTLSYSITSGAVPSGLTFDSDGTIVGTTPDGGAADTTYNFTVTATDDENQTNSRAFNLVVLRNIYGYSIPQSLMFNSGDSQSLDFTPPGGGSNKVFTFSAWFKRSTLAATQDLFHTGPDTSNQFNIVFSSSNDNLYIIHETGNSDDFRLQTSQVFRDTSAWYHVVLAVNTTASVASNRLKLYINGEQITSFVAATYPSQNFNTRVNATNLHRLGGRTYDNGYFDGYMTDVYLIDGLALTPTSFGESYNGVWVPIDYAGSYGTNGFYLPMRNSGITGFNAITYRGDGTGSRDRAGVGFEADLIWVKDLGDTSGHHIMDQVRGVNNVLVINPTSAEFSNGSRIERMTSDGFVTNNGGGINQNNANYVAWCWKAGDTTVSNTDGDLTASVRANPTYGFSIITYTGNGSAGTSIGHGLGSTPDFLIIKSRGTTAGWSVNHVSTGMTSGYLQLHATNAFTSAANNVTAIDSSTFTVGSDSWLNGSDVNYVAYAWTAVAGFSAFGSYTGDDTTDGSNTITLGFKPAWIIIKRSDSTGNWGIFDTTRSANDPTDVDDMIFSDVNNAQQANNANWTIEISDTGFAPKNATYNNASGGTYIYAAFADTASYKFWRDYSGNSNDWQPVNTGADQVTPDSPTE